LKFYADKLCVSPKHLSFLIKNATGLPANKWVTDAVIHDAKHLLQSSGNSVKEIAYILNFSNQSFFGKYFKREVGVSPSDYQSEVLC
jgi:transcriptional regulator, AraC family